MVWICKWLYSKANKIFIKACNGGSAEACNNLGYNYYKGFGTKKDILKAKESFRKGCDLGYNASCENCALLDNKKPNILKK